MKDAVGRLRHHASDADNRPKAASTEVLFPTIDSAPSARTLADHKKYQYKSGPAARAENESIAATARKMKGAFVENKTEIIELTADIVAAYVGNNAVPTGDLTNLINGIYRALAGAVEGKEEKPQEELKPAVPARRSVTPDAIICLEDGMKFKSLKRHLGTHHNLTPEEYRSKWGLPQDYPMVAPAYAEARSQLAKKIGLGQKRRRKGT